MFYRNRRDRSCWVLDESDVASVSVNDAESVRNKRLKANDIIDIAGARLCFDGESVFPADYAKGGVTLSAHEVSVALGGRTILRNVSFVLRPGEFVGVLGPSGCGKSTLLQHVAGLTYRADCKGMIAFNGNPRESIPGGVSGICAYLPQDAEHMLHKSLSLRDEMSCFLGVHGIGHESEDEIEPMLELLGLREEIDAPIAKLSGGQKRRAAIAMTLLRKPRVFLLDEPTAGLDPSSDAEVMHYLHKIAMNRRIAILCSSHVLGNMNQFTKVLALTGGKGASSNLNGRLVFCGPPHMLMSAVCPSRGEMLSTDDVVSAVSERLAEVYSILQMGAPSLASVPDVTCNEARLSIPEALVESPREVSSFCGYLRRMWSAFRFRNERAKDFMAKEDWSKEFFAPIKSLVSLLCAVPTLLFFWLPMGIVACVRVGCDRDFTEPSTGTLYFCCIIALFLLGLCHSATRLVDGRIPGRCLERLAGVSIHSFLASKVVGSIGLCLAQTVTFCVFWQLSIMLPRGWFSASPGGEVQLVGPLSSFWTIPIFFVISLMGSIVGLSVSAIAKERSVAVNVVPVVAVIVLFFSQPNIGYPLSDVASSKRAQPPSFAEKISYLTPTVYPQRFLAAAYQKHAAFVSASSENASLQAKNHYAKVAKDFNAVSFRLLGLFVLYFSAAALVLWYFEPLRERQWSGR